jgi:hypothetical protein
MYHAVCSGVVDLGSRKNQFGNNVRSVLIQFEIPEIRSDEDKPRVQSRMFTLSMHEKSRLRELLESWRGKRFTEEDLKDKKWDVCQMIGENAMLQILHDKKGENTYAKIKNILPYKGEKKAPELDQIQFSLAESVDDDMLLLLPEWMQKMIKESPEYKEQKESAAVEAPAELDTF